MLEGMYVEVPVRKENKTAQLQFQLEEDVNLPEMKPDLEVPVAQKWNIITKDVKAGNGKVCIEGEVEYLILYAREDATGSLEVLNGVFPFNQCLIMDTEDKEGIETSVALIDEQVKKRNSRKLSVLLTLELEAHKEGSRIQKFMEDTSENVEKKMGVLNTMAFSDMGRENISFKEIIALPSNRPDIGRILMDRVQLRGMELRLEEGKLVLKGEAFLFVLYESGEENPRVQFLELSIPVESQMDCAICNEDMIPEYQYKVLRATLTPQPNEDGEERDFSLHIDVELSYVLKEEREYGYLEDVYALSGNVRPVREEMEFERLRLRHSMRVRVNDIFSPPLEEKILQIFPLQGNVTLTEPEVVENGVLVEGALHMDVIYITANPSDPPAVARLQIPFHQQIQNMGIERPVRIHSLADVVQLTANIMDSRQAEIKGVINLNVGIYENRAFSMITSLEEVTEGDKGEQLPGMVGYVVQRGDSLWNLAKENRTTIEEIREVNRIAGEEVTEGEKILICRNA